MQLVLFYLIFDGDDLWTPKAAQFSSMKNPSRCARWHTGHSIAKHSQSRGSSTPGQNEYELYIFLTTMMTISFILSPASLCTHFGGGGHVSC